MGAPCMEVLGQIEAKVIIVVRSPVDICYSLYLETFRSQDRGAQGARSHRLRCHDMACPGALRGAKCFARQTHAVRAGESGGRPKKANEQESGAACQCMSVARQPGSGSSERIVSTRVAGCRHSAALCPLPVAGLRSLSALLREGGGGHAAGGRRHHAMLLHRWHGHVMRRGLTHWVNRLLSVQTRDWLTARRVRHGGGALIWKTAMRIPGPVLRRWEDGLAGLLRVTRTTASTDDARACGGSRCARERRARRFCLQALVIRGPCGVVSPFQRKKKSQQGSGSSERIVSTRVAGRRHSAHAGEQCRIAAQGGAAG